jgi:hypothetical protein
MNQWEGYRDSLAINEPGSNKCSISAREAGLLQDLLQGTLSFGFFQEESNSFLKVR